MSAHTDGRLLVDSRADSDKAYAELFIDGGLTIADGLIYANARRLAACWNSFIGVSTEDIEAMGGVVLFKGEPVGELAELRTERDQLRAERSDLQLEARHREEVNQVLVSQLAEARALLAEVLKLNDDSNIHTTSWDITVDTDEFIGLVERIRALLKGGEA